MLYSVSLYISFNNKYIFSLSYRTALMLFKMIIEYCQCAEELPMLAPDLANRLVELLKVCDFFC